MKTRLTMLIMLLLGLMGMVVCVHAYLDEGFYARLNVQHGPNVEQLVREVEFKGEEGKAEFDLAYTRINDRRIEKAWLDLILESPEMTRIAIRDCVVLRAPRADI